MKNLLNSKWLIFINIIPTIILFSIYYGEFSIIKTLLSEESIGLWFTFGKILLVISALNLAYIIFSIVKKKEVSLIYSIISLIVYTAFMYAFVYHSDDIIPWSIPRWMTSGNLTLYVGTFLMPTLAYALFTIVVKLTSEDKTHKAWKNFLAAIAIPLAFYLFNLLILPLWRSASSSIGTHAFIVIMVIGVILFLFFLIRTIYILSVKKGKSILKYQLVWKIPIAIIFPVIGLFINNNESFAASIFGDFNGFWFYAIALLNGLLLCVPNPKKKHIRLLLFIGRSLTFSYTFYFFLVFLPFLPLSIIAIIAVGTGFLMLTPLVLFIIHVQELTRDLNHLKTYWSKDKLIIISIVASCVLPIAITASFISDRQVLYNTLEYVYTPDYFKEYNIDKTSLAKTLEVVKSNKDRGSGFDFGHETPYISSFFKWLVLDNLTLSNSKIAKIERVFFNAEPLAKRRENIRNDKVTISNISSSSEYNNLDNTWKSWVDLEITNANNMNFFSEYATTINLPEGTWISDYYLYGILSEKKSAMWVFSQIRNENRDPGFLYYLTGNNVAFRVFPFAKDEVRRTGIQFIHKEPIRLNFDNHLVELGTPRSNTYQTKDTSAAPVTYVSSEEKKALPIIERKPYYHFIIDASEDSEILKDTYINTIESFMNNEAFSLKEAKISFANNGATTLEMSQDWKGILNQEKFESGFFLERAIDKILVNSYQNLSDTYPVIIVVTENILKAIVEKDFTNLKIAFPESNYFYHLNTLGNISKHDLTKNPIEALESETSITLGHKVKVWPNSSTPLAYLANNEAPEVVLKSHTFQIDKSPSSAWQYGLLLKAKSLSHTLNPSLGETEWNEMVKHSFTSKVMTPLTSYIVVENEAQKAALLKKQQEALAGKKSLDLGEDPQQMSEPGLLILLFLSGFYFLFKHRKRLLLN